MQNGNWLNDAIVMQFSRTVSFEYSSSSDRRVIVLSSQALLATRRFTRQSRSVLKGWLEGINIHDFDLLLGTICAQSHWRLVVVDVHSFEVIILDPFELVDETRISFSLRDSVLSALSEMVFNYCWRYACLIKWTFATGINLINKFNFPRQPSSNAVDCGVFLCIYIVSIISNTSFAPQL